MEHDVRIKFIYGSELEKGQSTLRGLCLLVGTVKAVGSTIKLCARPEMLHAVSPNFQRTGRLWGWRTGATPVPPSVESGDPLVLGSSVIACYL